MWPLLSVLRALAVLPQQVAPYRCRSRYEDHFPFALGPYLLSPVFICVHLWFQGVVIFYFPFSIIGIFTPDLRAKSMASG